MDDKTPTEPRGNNVLLCLDTYTYRHTRPYILGNLLDKIYNLRKHELYITSTTYCISISSEPRGS